ncbi:MAG: D-alanyl-D-alanine carboxypeptidase family protein [Dongiaceae bacterium]
MSFLGLFSALIVAGAQPAWAAKSASIVVDAETGTVLYESNSRAQAYPASLTKMMTLYLLFEAVESKKLGLDDDLPVSERAANQPPTDLRLKAGGTITVRKAIQALIVQSANDVAVTVAEAIGGSEDKFARQMTKTAKQLGMKQTVFKNASGLPNSGQLTTARDMAILARALMSRFPDHYEFFNTQSFRYNGRTYQTHNRVLKNYPGADGLKTGYTRASGYNLATSAERNGHRLIGIVLGGKSARGRDAQMMALLDEGFMLADSGVMSVATSLPSVQPPAEKAAKPAALGVSIAMIPPVKPTYEIDDPNAASLDSLVAQVMPTAEAEGDGGIIAEALAAPAPTQVALLAPAPAPVKTADSGKVTWGIQVGAFTAEQPAAKAAAAATEKLPKLLQGTQVAVDEITGEDGNKLFRARLIGLGEKDARKACTELQNQSMPCMAFKANVTLAFNKAP